MATFKVGETVAQKTAPGRKGTIIHILKPGPYGRLLVRFPPNAPVSLSPDQLENA